MFSIAQVVDGEPALAVPPSIVSLIESAAASFEVDRDASRQFLLRAMRTTTEPLSQIAVQCGLCDQSHLCRLFRRLIGQTPNARRRANVRGRDRAVSEGICVPV